MSVRPRLRLVILVVAGGVAAAAVGFYQPAPRQVAAGRTLSVDSLRLAGLPSGVLAVREYSDSGADVHYCYHPSYVLNFTIDRDTLGQPQAIAVAESLALRTIPEADQHAKVYVAVGVSEPNSGHREPRSWTFVWRRHRTGDWRPFAADMPVRLLPTFPGAESLGRSAAPGS